MIDELDRELLQTITERMALVGEVAAYKRLHGLKVRDASREQALLSDRASRAEQLGLPGGEMESIFRVLLRASRDHQSALRAEVPFDQEVRTVAVVGANGGFGRVLVRLFGDLGHTVIEADIDTVLRPAEAAAIADVTVLAVPIEATG